MTGLAIDRILGALESWGVRYRRQSNGNHSARCPHHEGTGETSLSIRGVEGRALVHCFSGCSTEDVVSSLGLTMADLFDEPRGQSYQYTDAGGRPTRAVHRSPDKRFRQTGDTTRVDLYRLPNVRAAAIAGLPIYLVEGEQDVHTLESLGQVATTAPMGGGNFAKVDVSPLKDATVIAIPDNDATGRRWAEAVHQRLDGYAASVTWYRAKEGKDVTDHVLRGHGLEDLNAAEAPTPTPAAVEAVKPAAVEAPEPSDSADDEGQGVEFPGPCDPMPVARQLLTDRQVDGVLTTRLWSGGWMVWTGPHWTEVERAEITSWIWRRLEHALYLDTRGDEPKLVPWRPNQRRVADVQAALGAATHLSGEVTPPTWITRARATDMDRDHTWISTANGLLDVTTRKTRPHTPEFLNLVSTPFDYTPDAPKPKRWLEFLAGLWPDDPEAIAALREFVGYILSGRTDLQRILLIVGPPRSGKGTIGRILTALVGKGAMAGPTLSSLATPFGLAPLIGKPLAIISDARLAGRDTQQIVERLLTISGEDTVDVGRKYREDWIGRLPTRLVILSNELPNLGDASGAIATRFLTLQLLESHLGREDFDLDRDLTRELPGILNWALDGLRHLETAGRFSEPESSRAALREMMALSSPVTSFLDEHCEVGPDLLAPVDEVFAAWREWCEETGTRVGSQQLFGRNLRAARPSISISRPRNPGGKRYRAYAGIRLRSDRSTTGPHGPNSVHETEASKPDVTAGQSTSGPHGPHGPRYSEKKRPRESGEERREETGRSRDNNKENRGPCGPPGPTPAQRLCPDLLTTDQIVDQVDGDDWEYGEV